MQEAGGRGLSLFVPRGQSRWLAGWGAGRRGGPLAGLPRSAASVAPWRSRRLLFLQSLNFSHRAAGAELPEALSLSLRSTSAVISLHSQSLKPSAHGPQTLMGTLVPGGGAPYNDTLLGPT